MYTQPRLPIPKKYNWKRRWHPRYATTSSGERQARLENLGALQDATKPVYFDDIRHIPCLILIGEPGIGKTEALRNEYSKLISANPADEVDFIDIEGVNNSEALEKKVFSNPIFVSWENGTHKLTIFIDSLDRALIPVSTVVKTLAQKLRYVDVKRLNLRVACRDIDWSITIADEFTEIWRNAYRISQSSPDPKLQIQDSKNDYISVSAQTSRIENKPHPTVVNINDLIQVYQLAPIDIEDLIVAAKDNDISPEDFLQRLRELDSLTLATTPITLNCIISKFKESPGHFHVPLDRKTLFRDCCLQLCTHHNDEEYATTLEQRFKIAARIAAVMIYTNSYWIALDRSLPTPEATLSITDTLNSMSEQEELSVRDVLSTALFRGEKNLRTFVHRSFAEFLAAIYLDTNNVPLPRILEISRTSKGEFAPQLSETIRWLSEIRSDMAQAVVAREPYLLLSSDLSYVSAIDFEKFLHNLLTLDDEYIYVSLTNDLREQRARINHPALGRLLPPYLTDKSRSTYLRRFITVMIDRFKIQGLDKELINIVLDTHEDDVLRRLAADAIYGVGTDDTKKALKPFIYGRTDDPDDELKGYALLSLWPSYITASELFRCLSHPKRSGFFGSYQLFLSPDRLVSPINVNDLPIALDWASHQQRDHELPYSFGEIIAAIMRKGWDNIDDDRVLEAFASAALNRVLTFNPIFGESREDIGSGSGKQPTAEDYLHSFIAARHKRRQILELLVPICLKHQFKSHELQSFVFRTDLDWLTQEIIFETNSEKTTYWIELVTSILGQIVGWYFRSFQEADLPDIDIIYQACEQSTELQNSTKYYFAEWLFADPLVVKRREDYSEMRRRAEELEISPYDPPILVRIETALQRVEVHNYKEWVNVVFALLLRPDGRGGWFNFDPDITDLEAWRICTPTIQKRIVEAAQDYVMFQANESNPGIGNQTSEEDWFVTGQHIPYIEITGYLAIFLLLQETPAFIETIPITRWQRWSRVLLWFPFQSGIRMDRQEQDKHRLELQYKLISITYKQIPQETISLLVSMINSENRQSQHIFVLYKFLHCWDEYIETALIEKAKDASLSPTALNELLEYLLNHKSVKAQELIEKIIKAGYRGDKQREVAINAITAWFRHPIKFHWELIWNTMLRDEELGKAVTAKIADWEYNIAAFAGQMTENQIAGFYVWLENTYPHAQDPQVDGMHAVSSREEVGRLRDSLLGHLKGLGTPEAKAAIEYIAIQFPDYEWVQFIRAELQRTIVENDWQPSSPSQILQLEIQKKNRFWGDWFIGRKSPIFWGVLGIAATTICTIIAIIASLLIPLFFNNQPIDLTPASTLNIIPSPTVYTTPPHTPESEITPLPDSTENPGF